MTDTARRRVVQATYQDRSDFVVLCWGEKGQVGHFDESRATTPSPLRTLPVTQVRSLSVGASHAVVAFENGVFSWGSGMHGALGHCDQVDCQSPMQIEALKGLDIVQVACGGTHSVALTKQGHVYTWGTGFNGELGIGEEKQTSFVPTRIPLFGGSGPPDDEKPKPRPKDDRSLPPILDSKVVKIACGWNHSFALLEDGSVYAWGSGRFGQLGVGEGETDNKFFPVRVKPLDGLGVIQMACGRSHSLFLCSTGEVYACGHNLNFQLGFADVKQLDTPQLLTSLRGKHVCEIACGSAHSVALTAFGTVLAWGSGNAGRLGTGDSKDRAEPTVVKSLVEKGIRVSSIAMGCSAFHTMVVTENGQVAIWGCGRNGVIGIEELDNQKEPVILQTLKGARICVGACGQRLSVAVHCALSTNVVGGGYTLTYESNPAAVALAETGVQVLAKEYESLAGELDKLRVAVRDKEQKLMDMEEQKLKLEAQKLESMTVNELNDLESLYITGIEKIAAAKQDAIISEIRRKEEEARMAMEEKYKTFLAKIRKKEDSAQKEMQEQQSLHEKLNVRVQKLRLAMEECLQHLEQKNQLDDDNKKLKEFISTTRAQTQETRLRIEELKSQLTDTKASNEDMRLKLKALQEEYSAMQEAVSLVRKECRDIDALIEREEERRERMCGVIFPPGFFAGEKKTIEKTSLINVEKLSHLTMEDLVALHERHRRACLILQRVEAERNLNVSANPLSRDTLQLSKDPMAKKMGIRSLVKKS